MMHHTQRLAMDNGRISFKAGLVMTEANPYRKTSASYASFVRGFMEAEKAALKSTAAKGGSQ